MSVAMTGVDRIADAFASHGKRAALMPYLMGGYPSLDASAEAGLAAAAAGADLMELGMPFSDPLADGPVIHAAATEALAAGATPHGVLRVCERVSAQLPVVLMVYVNVVLTAGPEAFALRAACDAEGLALVPLVAPTTTPERIASIGADARGFVYTVSLTGTTGERNELPAGLRETVERVRVSTDVPVAVGFGISTADQASAVADIADGVIVGSRVVRAAGEGGHSAVGSVVAELAGAMKS